jgi:hypothetical protein
MIRLAAGERGRERLWSFSPSFTHGGSLTALTIKVTGQSLAARFSVSSAGLGCSSIALSLRLQVGRSCR